MLRLLLVLSLLLAPAASAAESMLEDVLERGSLRVGLSSFIPWAMRDKNGEFIGFEVDVAREVAKDMGVELEIVPTAWDGIIPALLAKKFDIIIGGMFITPARNLQINFTRPYDETGLGLIANRKLAAGFNSIEDFNNSEVTFALRRGTYPVTYVKENLPLAGIVQFDDDTSARQELINGRAHAWIASEPEPRFSELAHPVVLFRPITERLTTNQQGMGLRKGDADSLNFFNNWILVKEKSGWLQARHQYWFEGRAWADQLAE